jgi:hypothetical protein
MIVGEVGLFWGTGCLKRRKLRLGVNTDTTPASSKPSLASIPLTAVAAITGW